MGISAIYIFSDASILKVDDIAGLHYKPMIIVETVQSFLDC